MGPRTPTTRKRESALTVNLTKNPSFTHCPIGQVPSRSCGNSTSPSVIFCHPSPRHILQEVTRLPHSEPGRRSPRLRLTEDTPIAIRCLDGKRVSGNLHYVSVTGGLVTPTSLIPPCSLVSVIFVTLKEPVVGTAQMLHPVSWREQPFRFTAVLDSYKHRLEVMIRRAATKTVTSGIGVLYNWSASA